MLRRPKSLTRTILEPIALAIGLGLLARAAVHIYSIPSASMAPTLEVGDQIVVTPYFGGMPERGDIVVFQSILAEDELVVKRVIAVPGDVVDSRLGRVRVGGYTLPEPYVLRQAATGAISSQIVPAETYFVLGDNRDDSLDSRSWGVVPRSHIVGRARMILWSSRVDPEDSVRATTTSPETRATQSESRRRVFKWLR
jgi:signal peptidase I